MEGRPHATGLGWRWRGPGPGAQNLNRRFEQAGARAARAAPSAPGTLPRGPSGRREAAGDSETRATPGCQPVAAPQPPVWTRAAAAVLVVVAPSSNAQGRSQRRAALRPAAPAWRRAISRGRGLSPSRRPEGAKQGTARADLAKQRCCGCRRHNACTYKCTVTTDARRYIAGHARRHRHTPYLGPALDRLSRCTRCAESTRACLGRRRARKEWRRTLEHWSTWTCNRTRCLWIRTSWRWPLRRALTRSW